MMMHILIELHGDGNKSWLNSYAILSLSHQYDCFASDYYHHYWFWSCIIMHEFAEGFIGCGRRWEACLLVWVIVFISNWKVDRTYKRLIIFFPLLLVFCSEIYQLMWQAFNCLMTFSSLLRRVYCMIFPRRFRLLVHLCVCATIICSGLRQSYW